MRFYHCFNTTLPDQFVEANAGALTRWVDGWRDQARYYRRAQIVDNVALAVLGDAGKTRWPTLVSTSDTMLYLWMAKKGDAYNGRYWETLAADQCGAADPASDPGRDAADALAFAWIPRTGLPATSCRSFPGGRTGGKRLTTRQIVQAAQMLPGGVTWIGSDLAAEDPPPLHREGIVAGEITGQRCWRVEQGFLRSVYQDDIWPPGQPMQGRELGDWDSRGIHAWKSNAAKEFFLYVRSYLNRAGDGGMFGPSIMDCHETRPAMVTGTVLLWGDVVEHERGWRAEFARVASLDWLYPDASMMGREAQTLDDLRRHYGLNKELHR